MMRVLERLRTTPLERLDPAAGEPDRHARIPYEPALDGLRGLAVLAVVLYHADLVYGGRQWFGGGFLGVDAFFVLSGFLITALLIVEHQNNGHIALRDFWVRRARRLLPALFALIVVAVGYAILFADLSELARIRRHGTASLFYVANWQYIHEGTSYFTQFDVESPFQHVWSLAIEEQWYLLWPLVVWGLLRWRSSVRLVMGVSLTGAALSAAWMAVLYQPGTDPSRVYFGTDTRAQSLLLGSALSAALIAGVTVHDRFARHVLPALAAVAGTVVVAVWVLGSWTSDWYYQGGLLLLAIAVGTVVVAAVQPDENIVRRALSVRPFVALGVISYGVYLWHWPIFLFLSRRRDFLEDWSFEAITALRLVTTLVVSIASYVFIERPIRLGLLRRRIRFSPVLLPVSIVALLGLLYVGTGGASRPTLSTAEASGTPGPLPTKDDLSEGINPASRPPPQDASTTTATKVLIVGDSVAYSMAGGFTPEIQQESHLLVWNQTVLFCELATGPRLENGIVVEPSDTCDDWDEIWRGDVEEFQPHVAVLQVGAWEIFNRKIDGHWLVFGTAEYDRYFLSLLDEALDTLSSEGATVVVLSSPHFERADTISAREWTQNETWRTEHINELFARATADHPSAVLVPFGEWMCPTEPPCLQYLAGGIPVREDGIHFTDEGAQIAAQWLAPQLRAIALATGSLASTPTTTTSEPPPTSETPTTGPPDTGSPDTGSPDSGSPPSDPSSADSTTTAPPSGSGERNEP
jgi:peptidoglycan/LPS O-acetylase OafA/YrhL